MHQFLALRKSILENTFSKLNNMQKKAVFSVNGPLLILAGAGSGKTTVLINRIVNMIKFGDAYNSDKAQTIISEDDIKFLSRVSQKNGELSEEEKLRVEELVAVNAVKPWNILTITFTNKAANELKDRLELALGEKGRDVNAGTFHSACVRILRRDIEKIGYQKNFTIYDTDDSKRVVKECLNALHLDEKRFPPKQMLSEISRAKDKLQTPEKFSSDGMGDFYRQGVSRVYSMYQARLKNANALDFDDIIMLTVRLFEESPETLEYYRNRYKYIMVDEYQDTNMAQYKLISLLAGEHKNLCVVGDDDQSIYRFRGATIENILNFEHQFENTKVIRLEQNYRSTQNILDAANAVIKNNTERKGKNLWTSQGSGEKIVQFRCDDERGEAEYVTDRILDRIAEGGSYGDCAVLYRTNSQSNNFERSFVKSGVPYRIIGGHRFYDRMEIKDIVSYLCVINNSDDELRLERILNQPKRGIGDASIKAAKEISSALGQSLFETVCRADEYVALKRSASAMRAFGKMIRSLSEKSENCTDLGAFVDEVIKMSGYDAYLNSLGDEGLTRIDNVQELVNTMTRYSEENPDARLSDYLEEVSLMSDVDNYDSESDSVVLMTIHSAKGLEFNEVFLVGMEDGVFPGVMSLNSSSELEEERRLAYVGVTRAKQKLHLTSCAYRMMYGKSQRNRISRFVNEIPDSLKEIIDRCYSEPCYEEGFSGSSFSGKSFDTGFSLGYSKERNKPMFTTSSVVSNKPQSSSLDYKVGDSVVHRVFGEGMVVSMTPMANDTLVEISFDRVGTKKIMANFAKLTKK
ncbi:MAG: ATP-dependent DNA helicase PcrA [Ruminococcaceae bacterium]|nr:ATP-dependent DNA helicase PcrA [Oscillospiraceae bacterium]